MVAPQNPARPSFPRSEAVYALLASIFVSVLVLTNIIGTKLFVLFPDGGPEWLLGGSPWTLTSGIVTYPITFLLTDVVSELWGKKRADFMVLAGFGMSLLMLGVLQFAIQLPPSPNWVLADFGLADSAAVQNAFHATFSSPSILLLASMTAYLVAQLFDVRLYHFWWRLTQGRHMWLRNNGSTLISQLVDTIIVNTIFLRWGPLGLEWGTIGEVIVAVYLCKAVLALVDTPLIYLVCGALSRFLGVDPSSTRTSAPLA